MKFSIKDFFSKCVQGNCGFGHIYWRNPFMKNFIFCSVGFHTHKDQSSALEQSFNLEVTTESFQVMLLRIVMIINF